MWNHSVRNSLTLHNERFYSLVNQGQMDDKIYKKIIPVDSWLGELRWLLDKNHQTNIFKFSFTCPG